jgi:hypothetical protein
MSLNHFKIGDLVGIQNTNNTWEYAIILEVNSRFGYVEMRVLFCKKVISLIYDGRKNSIKLLQKLENVI